MKRQVVSVAILFFIVQLLSGCSMDSSEEKVVNRDTVTVDPALMKKLAGKKIYFGHHSVGYNIMGGVNDLLANLDSGVIISDSFRFQDLKGPAFAQSRIGYNTDPQSKIDQFANNIRLLKPWQPDVAAFKFCYVDFTVQTDVDRLFSSYKENYAAIKKENPEVVFVHFTVPLTVVGTGIKDRVKTLIGRVDGRKIENRVRNRFNDLLRQEYGGRDPIFDLATLESIYANGTREEFVLDGKQYYALVPSYSSDGAHLNKYGSQLIAKQLLEFLAAL